MKIPRLRLPLAAARLCTRSARIRGVNGEDAICGVARVRVRREHGERPLRRRRVAQHDKQQHRMEAMPNGDYGLIMDICSAEGSPLTRRSLVRCFIEVRQIALCRQFSPRH